MMVVGAADDLPCVPVVVDVAPPGQRLISDANAAFCRPLTQFIKIAGGPVDAAQSERRDIRTEAAVAVIVPRDHGRGAVCRGRSLWA